MWWISSNVVWNWSNEDADYIIEQKERLMEFYFETKSTEQTQRHDQCHFGVR